MRRICRFPLFSLSVVLGLFFFAGAANGNPVPVAACCLHDGSCSMMDEINCLAADGYWMGEVWSCQPDPCTGACCTEFGTCVDENLWDCIIPLGAFMGPFTTCLSDPCNIGACCLPGGDCQMLHDSECLEQGGVFTIEQYGCELQPCEHLGPCCRPDRTCFVTVQLLCSGEWMGEGGSCLPNPCDPAAAPDAPVPASTPLLTAAPNPFVGETVIRFTSPAEGALSCRIVDPRGRVVRELSLSGSSVRWDGRDNAGRVLPAGAYYAQVRAGNVESSLVLLHLH